MVPIKPATAVQQNIAPKPSMLHAQLLASDIKQPIIPAAYHVFPLAPNQLVACALSALCLTTSPNTALAAIPLTAPPPQEQQRRALNQLGLSVRRPDQRNSNVEEESVKQKIKRVTALITASNQAAEVGDWNESLRCQSEIISRYPDLALAERARIARALLLYQVDRPEDALLQLEDEEVALRGSAEVHAALAVVFYGLGKPIQAEQQWAVASEFDKRYSDLAWVQRERHWPPKLLQALEKFLTLT